MRHNLRRAGPLVVRNVTGVDETRPSSKASDVYRCTCLLRPRTRDVPAFESRHQSTAATILAMNAPSMFSAVSASRILAPCSRASLRCNLTAFRGSPTHSLAQRFSNQPYSLWTAHHFQSIGSRPKPPSILQLLSSSSRNATHRTRITRASSRSPLRPHLPSGSFRPPGLEGGWKGFVRWVNGLPQVAIIWGILGLNGIVYLMWNWAHIKYVSLHLSSE